MRYILLVVFCCWGFTAQSAVFSIRGLELDLPSHWRLKQEATDRERLVLGFSNGKEYIHFFVEPDRGELPLQRYRSVPVRDAWQIRDGALSWNLLQTAYKRPEENGGEITFTTTFFHSRDGQIYFGYVSSTNQQDSSYAAREFIQRISLPSGRSLTTGFFFGEKYYLGFGEYLTGSMGNEVKYDIKHTHDIFTTDVGGNYTGTTILGAGQGGPQVRQYWQRLQDDMTWNDMYVQYSAGHGHTSGLAIGLRYDEIRDNILSLPAKEMVVFIMACHSGGLVDSFNRKKAIWENFGDYDRTLLVMASSKVSELSYTGPGTDFEEPGGPHGSAGSAFGHSLWKALIGHSDGHGNGVKDGMISLGEIIDFTTWKTKSGWGHTPVHTGVFNRNMVMNRVPNAEELARFKGGTEGLTPEEIALRVSELDRELRIRSLQK